MSENAKWYVIHTYSGYENAVKTSIEKVRRPAAAWRIMILRIGDPHGDRDGGHANPARRKKSSARYSPAMCSSRWS